MKVMHILLSNHIGGPNIRVLSTSKGLKNLNFESIIVCPSGKGNFAELAINNELKTYQITLNSPKFLTNFRSLFENIKWVLTFPISVYEIIKIIKKEEVDIIHSYGLLNIPGPIAAKLSGKKVVWSLLGSVYPNWLISLLMPFIIFISDHMIFIANKLAHYYLKNKINALKYKYNIIYECINTEKFNHKNILSTAVVDLKREFEIKNNEKIVGCIGNINPAKGYEYLIKAADLLINAGINVKFIIIGARLESQERYYQRIKKLIDDLELNKYFIFTGKRDDIPELISIMDLFVLPSVAEGTPLVILEAMSMGKSIVATDVGAISEQIISNYNGMIVEPKNVKAIFESVNYLLKNDAKRHMLEKSAKKYSNNFSLEKCVTKYVEVYKNVLTEV
ncbi:glycosyltransferase [Methanobacterium formicicum]|uniref:Uncharacterized protein n=1 Tax=Methanobacterium formicicum TaxID=2162 RepID=A0A0S4FPJ9_METFO|nr:glycosyltransferase [Methanobacterium formicicum]CEL25001.1 hypothetical protein MB9_1364 [Methanobacterium formicicum]